MLHRDLPRGRFGDCSLVDYYESFVGMESKSLVLVYVHVMMEDERRRLAVV